jgi:farnesyl diphosphate synthase
VPPALQARLCSLLARASGVEGMAGGQAIDLASVGRPLTEPQLQDMHRRKTGALLQASVMMGAACGELPGRAAAALSDYGWAIGLAFQVVDDILDCTQDSEVLGKTAGKDADQNKPTYVSLLGLEGARARADALHARARAALETSDLPDTSTLAVLADRVIDRVS